MRMVDEEEAAVKKLSLSRERPKREREKRIFKKEAPE